MTGFTDDKAEEDLKRVAAQPSLIMGINAGYNLIVRFGAVNQEYYPILPELLDDLLDKISASQDLEAARVNLRPREDSFVPPQDQPHN